MFVGRFITADSIVPNPENGQSFNRYSCVLGNPIIYTDPTGHYHKGGDGTSDGDEKRGSSKQRDKDRRERKERDKRERKQTNKQKRADARAKAKESVKAKAAEEARKRKVADVIYSQALANQIPLPTRSCPPPLTGPAPQQPPRKK